MYAPGASPAAIRGSRVRRVIGVSVGDDIAGIPEPTTARRPGRRTADYRRTVSGQRQTPCTLSRAMPKARSLSGYNRRTVPLWTVKRFDLPNCAEAVSGQG